MSTFQFPYSLEVFRSENTEQTRSYISSCVFLIIHMIVAANHESEYKFMQWILKPTVW